MTSLLTIVRGTFFGTRVVFSTVWKGCGTVLGGCGYGDFARNTKILGNGLFAGHGRFGGMKSLFTSFGGTFFGTRVVFSTAWKG